MNLTNLKLAGKGERIGRTLRACRGQLIRRWLQFLDTLDGEEECYMRWPGERKPSPRQQPGPRWDVHRDDWELAACRTRAAAAAADQKNATGFGNKEGSPSSASSTSCGTAVSASSSAYRTSTATFELSRSSSFSHRRGSYRARMEKL